jgi:hypothetical protein
MEVIQLKNRVLNLSTNIELKDQSAQRNQNKMSLFFFIFPLSIIKYKIKLKNIETNQDYIKIILKIKKPRVVIVEEEVILAVH